MDMVIYHIDMVISHIDMGDEANDMGDDRIDMVISHIDMGYLVTLAIDNKHAPALEPRSELDLQLRGSSRTLHSNRDRTCPLDLPSG